MTDLTRPVARFVTTTIDRRLVTLKVTLGLDGITFCEKGKHTSYLLPYQVAYWKACRLVAEQREREKRTK